MKNFSIKNISRISTNAKIKLEWIRRELEMAISSLDSDDTKNLILSKACEIYSNMVSTDLTHTDISEIIVTIERLNDEYPLTSLDENSSDWSVEYVTNEFTKYLSKRYPSFKKYVYLDGRVKYTDPRRISAYNNYEFRKGINPDDIIPGTNELLNSIMDELDPIRIPYYPAHESWTIYTTDVFTSKKKSIEYNVIMLKHVRYAIKKTGDKIMINRFYKLSNVNDQEKWEQIEWMEYSSIRDKIY